MVLRDIWKVKSIQSQTIKNFLHKKPFMVCSTKDERSMTTFYYGSVNHQSGLQRNTFLNYHMFILIHQNVPHIM